MTSKHEEIKHLFSSEYYNAHDEQDRLSCFEDATALLLKALELACHKIWEIAKKEQWVFGQDIEPNFWLEQAAKELETN